MNFATNTATDLMFSPPRSKKRQIFGRGTRVRFTCPVLFRASAGEQSHGPSVFAEGTTGTIKSVFPMFVIEIDSDHGYQEAKWHPALQVQQDLEIIPRKPALLLGK